MWNNLDSVYFIGAGGIGMSALARFFLSREKNVAGYDRTSTTLTDQLLREGVEIHFEDNSERIPKAFRDPERTLVIYTPAIPEENHELQFFRDHGFRIIKRSVALGEVFNGGYGIGVAGTHGKTSVSTMVAHIFHDSGVGCNAFLGGISKNFNSNLVTHSSSEVIIAEADEYDRSFHALYPKLAVVTSMDDDHLDIYKSSGQLLEGFQTYVDQIARGGTLIMRSDLSLEFSEGLKVLTYALEDETADYHLVSREQLEGGKFKIGVKTPSEQFTTVLGVPGLLNVENALAAIAVAEQQGIPMDQIAAACSTYSGVKRRFDVQVMNRFKVYIDDYAHHPKELKAFITSVREMLPEKKLTGIFQPHLYSRTRDFAADFASSLSLLDELILLDIYPAREEPIEGLDSGIIFREVTLKEKVWIKSEQLVRVLKERTPEVLLTMGAGDIDRLVDPLKNWMEAK